MIALALAVFVLLAGAVPAAAQSCFFSVTGCLSIQGLLGPSGEIEQTIFKAAGSTPLSTAGHARLMYSGGQLLLSTEGGAYAPVGMGAGGGAPTTATYLLQTSDAALPNAQAMGALGTGLVLNTTTTGVQSIYTGVSCGGGQFVSALDASGAGTCGTPAGGGDVTASGTLTANAFITGNGTTVVKAVAITGLVLGAGASAPAAYGGSGACAAGQFINELSASGVKTCATPAGGGNVSAAAALTSNAFVTGAGTTNVQVVAITGLVLGAGASAPGAYGGTSCGGGQVVSALSAAGVATCINPSAGGGITSLNLSTVPSQTFVNGTNIAVSTNTGTGAHTIGLTGQVGAANGGLGIDTSATSGVPTVSSGTWSVAATLAPLRGGTGLNTSGSSGIPSISGGTWTVTSVPAGLVLFASGSNGPATDANFIYTSTNLGVGTFNPIARFHAQADGAATITAVIEAKTASLHSSSLPALRLLATDTGQMLTGFGPVLEWVVLDADGTQQRHAYLRTGRSGADTTAAVEFGSMIGGVQAARWSIDNAGHMEATGGFRTGQFASASFPANSTSGRIAYQTDSVRGYHMDTGTQWLPVGLTRTVNVRLYGALGNNFTNDRAAIQAAADAVCAPSTTDKGGVLYFPAGWYRIDASIAINCGMVIQGDGWGDLESAGGSKIVLTSTTQDGFVLDAPNNVVIRDIGIASLTAQTDGSMIRFTGTSPSTSCLTRNPGTKITNVMFNKPWIGVRGTAVCGPAEVRGIMAREVQRSLIVMDGSDGGGFALRDSYAYCLTTNCVLVDGNGGITGNHLHATGSNAIVIRMTPSVFAEGFHVHNNIIESSGLLGETAMTITPSAQFINLTITGNHLYGMPNGIVISRTGSGTTENVTIVGNVINLGTGTGSCVDANFTIGGTISGNTCAQLGGSGSNTGILLRASASYLVIADNIFTSAIETPINLSSVASPDTISVSGGRLNVSGNLTHFVNYQLAGVTRFAVEESGTTIINNTSNEQYQLAVGSSGASGAAIALSGTTGGATSPNKFLRSLSNKFEIVNSGYSAVLLSVDELGRTDSTGGFAANGTNGITATKTVRAAGGGGNCTLEFIGGILVAGGTC